MPNTLKNDLWPRKFSLTFLNVLLRLRLRLLIKPLFLCRVDSQYNLDNC